MSTHGVLVLETCCKYFLTSPGVGKFGDVVGSISDESKNWQMIESVFSFQIINKATIHEPRNTFRKVISSIFDFSSELSCCVGSFVNSE